MISVSQAHAHIIAAHKKGRSFDVPLLEARRRILAADISAKLTQPPLTASAMDGYAVRSVDVSESGTKLNLIGEAPAGRPFKGTVNAFEAVRIFTGGAMPEGADSVIIQEEVTRDGDKITIDEPQDAPRHVRLAGIDFKSGDTLLKAGTVIGSAEIAVAAAAGHARLPVYAPLRVAIISGGDELVPIGETPQTGQVVNSNPTALAALIKLWGHVAIIIDQARDSEESIAGAIEKAKDSDIILTVGGASVGDHDYMRSAFKNAGIEITFEKIAVRPGKPTWFGKLDGTAVLGLPGNPASALVCAQLFLKPLLTGTLRNYHSAQLSQPVSANGPRETYHRAIASISTQGRLSVLPMPKQDSSLMTPFLKANALLRLKPDAPAKAVGDIADVLLIGEFHA